MRKLKTVYVTDLLTEAVTDFTYSLMGFLQDENVLTIDPSKKDVTIDYCIIQSKNTTSFGEDTIMKWKTTCENLFNMETDFDSLQDRYNKKVRDLFDLFRKIRISMVRKNPKINIKFYCITKGIDIHPNVKEQANYFIETVKIADYYKFMTDENGELLRHIFESNIRDYQGNIAVNRDIQETLKNPSSENFWWLNNGVTIIGSSARSSTEKEILIHDPEIVNGLQTSTEIHKYYSQSPNELDNDQREILVRIIIPANDDSRDKIIFSTNNQTRIQKSSLRATDTIHRQSEMFFKTREFFYDRHKNYYKNLGKKANQIISLQFLSQCLISVLLQSPNSARTRPSTLLTEIDIYKKLYPKNQGLDGFYNIAFTGKKLME